MSHAFPKFNTSYLAIENALTDVKSGKDRKCPESFKSRKS
jgi:replication-associated recombination protein RarA